MLSRCSQACDVREKYSAARGCRGTRRSCRQRDAQHRRAVTLASSRSQRWTRSREAVGATRSARAGPRPSHIEAPGWLTGGLQQSRPPRRTHSPSAGPSPAHLEEATRVGRTRTSCWPPVDGAQWRARSSTVSRAGWHRHRTGCGLDEQRSARLRPREVTVFEMVHACGFCQRAEPSRRDGLRGQPALRR